MHRTLNAIHSRLLYLFWTFADVYFGLENIWCQRSAPLIQFNGRIFVWTRVRVCWCVRGHFFCALSVVSFRAWNFVYCLLHKYTDGMYLPSSMKLHSSSSWSLERWWFQNVASTHARIGGMESHDRQERNQCGDSCGCTYSRKWQTRQPNTRCSRRDTIHDDSTFT